MKKVFINGSKALIEGSVYSGCRYYYGSPRAINRHILHYSSYRFPEVNGFFTQTESERSAIGMLIGSAISGARVLTSSTTDGIAAMEEGFAYLCGMEIPCVIANIMSGKMGFKNFEPTQSGYGQAVRGGTSGDYKFIVLAPSSVQDVYNLTIKAFELADKYKNPVMILMDSALAQNYQNTEINTELLSPDNFKKKEWTLTGAENREPNQYKLYHDADYKLKKFAEKFKDIDNEVILEEFMTEDAEHIYIAFGMVAEIVRENVIKQREKGMKVGLFRPITLSPFPKEKLLDISKRVDKITVVESNTGLMLYDVLNIVEDKKKVSFIGDTYLSSGFREISLELEKGLMV